MSHELDPLEEPDDDFYSSSPSPLQDYSTVEPVDVWVGYKPRVIERASSWTDYELHLHPPRAPFLYYAVTKLFVHAEKASDFRVRGNDSFVHAELQHIGKLHLPWLRTYRRLEAVSIETLNDNSSILHIFSHFGLYDLAKHYLGQANAYHVDVRDSFGNTALHLAAKSNHRAVAGVLVDRGAKVGATTESLQTPLMLAASNGHLSLVTWLLGKGANLNEALGTSQKVLQEASYRGHDEVVEMLLSAGADANAPEGEFGTALYAASYNGHVTVGQTLLRAGAAINAQGMFGTALQAASLQGHVRMTQMLIDAGAFVGATGDVHGTALYAASGKGHLDVVKALIRAKADINMNAGRYGTALHSAAAGGISDRSELKGKPHIDVMQELLSRGANVDPLSNEYGTPLQTAMSILALHQGVNQNNRDNESTWSGHDTGVLRPPCSIDTNSHLSPRGVVATLINAGANVDSASGTYGTALQAAVYIGNLNLVELLLDAGADVDASAGAFGKAVDTASMAGDQCMVSLLLKARAKARARKETDVHERPPPKKRR